MLRSMYAGVSGLRGHQTMMDVVGNNIANVNTAGYKASSTVFQDVLSQTLQGAGAPGGNLAGTNPAQVGLGSRVGAVQLNFSQGATQLTGRITDLAIQGDGLFAVRQGAEVLFTRAGSFNLDATGTLATPGGAIVQGWPATNGVIDTNAAVRDIQLPLGQTLPPTVTTKIRMGGNLSSDTKIGTPVVRSVPTYDAQGTARELAMSFTHEGSGVWRVTATLDGVDTGTNVPLTWQPNATPPAFTPGTLTIAGMTVDLASAAEPVTGYAGDSTLEALEQDGAPMGTLQSFTVSPDGTLVGVFSNGKKQPLAQVALGNFANPGGLEKIGNSLYRPTVNSGLAQVGAPGAGGRGLLAGGTLEMSNVDLAGEFTNLIVAQRGFQANSRVITASDELLQDLVNLKR